MELGPDFTGQRLDCGHTPGELFSIQGPGVFTDHETGEKVCRTCSDNRHYDRVRKQYAEIVARGEAEGWTYEYLETSHDAYVRRLELIGKLVVRAYWRSQDNPSRNIIQPAHMYNSAFKRLKDVVTNSPVTGFALVFEDGSRDALCYDKVCVITREPAGLDR
ncbi:hypothetical protein ACIQPR_48580 [Streptomyces sp. NPDC091280]|uniref:hypothetical protein n=1 Tax=Streptomyces sp. NPDC091280 TaxID=3365984 RepID=UPI0037F3236C